MEISFIHMQILVHLHVNKTTFHMEGIALEQRQKTTWKLPIKRLIRVCGITPSHTEVLFSKTLEGCCFMSNGQWATFILGQSCFFLRASCHDSKCFRLEETPEIW